MARKRHFRVSIAKVLRQAESGSSIADLARKADIHAIPFEFEKRKFGSLGTPEIRAINESCDVNTRLGRLVADLTLDIVLL